MKNEPPIIEENFVQYGDIQLSDEEKKCLDLGPKFMITPQMNKEDYQVEVEIEAVKTRMELHKLKDIEEENGKISEDSKKKIEKEDRESREVFNKKTKGSLVVGWW